MERKNEIDEKNIPNNKSLFLEITGGAKGSEVELYCGGFNQNRFSLCNFCLRSADEEYK